MGQFNANLVLIQVLVVVRTYLRSLNCIWFGNDPYQKWLIYAAYYNIVMLFGNDLVQVDNACREITDCNPFAFNTNIIPWVRFNSLHLGMFQFQVFKIRQGHSVNGLSNIASEFVFWILM